MGGGFAGVFVVVLRILTRVYSTNIHTSTSIYFSLLVICIIVAVLLFSALLKLPIIESRLRMCSILSKKEPTPKLPIFVQNEASPLLKDAFAAQYGGINAPILEPNPSLNFANQVSGGTIHGNVLATCLYEDCRIDHVHSKSRHRSKPKSLSSNDLKTMDKGVPEIQDDKVSKQMNKSIHKNNLPRASPVGSDYAGDDEGSPIKKQINPHNESITTSINNSKLPHLISTSTNAEKLFNRSKRLGNRPHRSFTEDLDMRLHSVATKHSDFTIADVAKKVEC